MTEPRDQLAEYLDQVLEHEAWASTGAEAAEHIRSVLGFQGPPEGPRSWSLPPEPPEDVRLRDRSGNEWIAWPRLDGRPLWRRADHDPSWATKISFVDVLLLFGPLTEVVDTDG